MKTPGCQSPGKPEVGGKRDGVVNFDVDSGTQGCADMASSDVEAPSGIGSMRNPDRINQIRGQRRRGNVLDFLGLLVNLESRRDDEKVLDRGSGKRSRQTPAPAN